jgi:gluconolactonase
VSSVGENLRTNGIMLSRDEKTLYVTNGPVVVALDVQPDGTVSSQRDFAKLEAGGSGDGLAVDGAGRLYVTSNPGVQVFGPEGKYLGVIPTPRGVISVAFSGPDKKTLYVVGSGALDANGQEVATPPGVRNNAKSIFKIPMLAQGFKGRAK